MARDAGRKGACQQIRSGSGGFRFSRGPYTGHEMGLRCDRFKTRRAHPGLDVITDVSAVVRLVKNSPEILHHNTEIG